MRRSRGEGLLEHVVSADEQVLPETQFSRILVPMKLGEIGEEMVATAVKLAQERGAAVEALHVIRVPLELPLDAELAEQEERAAESLEEAQALGEDHGVEVVGHTVRARAIGEAIVQAASRARHRPDRARLVARAGGGSRASSRRRSSTSSARRPARCSSSPFPRAFWKRP